MDDPNTSSSKLLDCSVASASESDNDAITKVTDEDISGGEGKKPRRSVWSRMSGFGPSLKFFRFVSRRRRKIDNQQQSVNKVPKSLKNTAKGVIHTKLVDRAKQRLNESMSSKQRKKGKDISSNILEDSRNEEWEERTTSCMCI